MENGLLVKTKEGSPQGGPLSPLLANTYLNEYDREMASRGVPVIRYVDDIVVLARSPRAAERLMETSQVRVPALIRLNRRVPNGTHDGVRGRRQKPPPTRFTSILHTIFRTRNLQCPIRLGSLPFPKKVL